MFTKGKRFFSSFFSESFAVRFLKIGTVYIMNDLAGKMIGERETRYFYVVIFWQF